MLPSIVKVAPILARQVVEIALLLIAAHAYSTGATAQKSLYFRPTSKPKPKPCARHNHGYAQPLTHTHSQRKQAQVGIRLPEELGDEAKEPIPREEHGRNLPPLALLGAVPPQQTKQYIMRFLHVSKDTVRIMLTQSQRVIRNGIPYECC